MGKRLNSFYARWASPGLLQVAKEFELEFSWIIEAGCHDSTDTLKFLELPNVLQVYAFEPDSVAANAAQEKLRNHKERVSLSRIALLDQPGFIQLSSPTGNFGDGTTRIDNFVNKVGPEVSLLGLIPCSTLDIELSSISGRGLIWLDVEGSAHKVLTGASQVLKNIDLIQVEVDLHDSRFRKGNFFNVNKILQKQGFAMIYGPLHPGFFGDALYVRRVILSYRGKLRCLFFNSLMWATHKHIFPLLNKPKP